MLKVVIFSIYVTAVSCDGWTNLVNLFTSDNDQGDAKVVGGQDAPEELAPYQISMQMKRGQSGGSLFPFLGQSKSEWSHFCGGSVLDENHIVTAAHWYVL
jgi:secreted trypsin-like serine protease